jgi:hypothetical protein
MVVEMVGPEKLRDPSRLLCSGCGGGSVSTFKEVRTRPTTVVTLVPLLMWGLCFCNVF